MATVTIRVVDGDGVADNTPRRVLGTLESEGPVAHGNNVVTLEPVLGVKGDANIWTLRLIASDDLSPPTAWRVHIENVTDRLIWVTDDAEFADIATHVPPAPGPTPTPTPVPPGTSGLVPAGGDTDDVLTKLSAVDFDYGWIAPATPVPTPPTPPVEYTIWAGSRLADNTFADVDFTTESELGEDHGLIPVFTGGRQYLAFAVPADSGDITGIALGSPSFFNINAYQQGPNTVTLNGIAYKYWASVSKQKASAVSGRPYYIQQADAVEGQ